MEKNNEQYKKKQGWNKTIKKYTTLKELFYIVED